MVSTTHTVMCLIHVYVYVLVLVHSHSIVRALKRHCSLQSIYIQMYHPTTKVRLRHSAQPLAFFFHLVALISFPLWISSIAAQISFVNRVMLPVCTAWPTSRTLWRLLQSGDIPKAVASRVAWPANRNEQLGQLSMRGQALQLGVWN